MWSCEVMWRSQKGESGRDEAWGETPEEAMDAVKERFESRGWGDLLGSDVKLDDLARFEMKLVQT